MTYVACRRKEIALMKKYLEVASYIEDYIAEHHLRTGDRLPSDKALAQTLNLTPVTVNKGMLMLARRNVIIRKVGCGSFVSSPVTERAKMVGIGMLMHSGSDAYGMTVTKAVHEAAARFNVKIHVGCTAAYGEDAIRQACMLAEDGCKSLILPWAPYYETPMLAEFIAHSPLPACVRVLIPGQEKHCVERPDIVGAGAVQMVEASCEYFRMLGEERIALVGPNTSDNPAMKDKLACYTEYISRNNMENFAVMLGPSQEEIDILASRWATYRGHLAIICYDDIFAIRFMASMHKLGLSAPEDFRILGDNDAAATLFNDPPLSSGRPDYTYIGESILQCAKAMADGKIWQSDIPSPNILVVRKSCGGAGRLGPEIASRLKTLGVTLEEQSGGNPAAEFGPAGGLQAGIYDRRRLAVAPR